MSNLLVFVSLQYILCATSRELEILLVHGMDPVWLPLNKVAVQLSIHSRVARRPHTSPVKGNHSKAWRCRCQRAPHPADILWENLHIPYRQRSTAWAKALKHCKMKDVLVFVREVHVADSGTRWTTLGGVRNWLLVRRLLPSGARKLQKSIDIMQMF